MNHTIEIPDSLADTLKSQARAHGLSAARYASSVIEKSLAAPVKTAKPEQSFDTGYGMWANMAPRRRLRK